MNPTFTPPSVSKRTRYRTATSLLLVFSLSLFESAFAYVPTFNQHRAYAVILLHDLPPEARSTLEKIKTGGPFAYRKDGITFGNREGQLPRKYYGYYSEYTVPTPGARDRGARRIIAGAGKERDARLSGEYYYTDDHYQNFKRIIER